MITNTVIFTKIAIIESLPRNEIQTGTQFYRYISGLSLRCPLSLNLHQVSSGNDLINQLLALEQEAKAGEIPIIHFETHGTFDGRGLITANSDVVAWADIAEILLRINLATDFNLIVFVAACNGGYLLEEMKLIKPSPFLMLLAPTDKVDPAEIMRATREFYEILLTTTNATKAIATINNQPLQEGQWFAHSAESWYLKIAINHIKEYCAPKFLKKRAQEIYVAELAQGRSINRREIKRTIKLLTHTKLVGEYFDRFFCTQTIPKNKYRFENFRQTISSEISLLVGSSKV